MAKPGKRPTFTLRAVQSSTPRHADVNTALVTGVNALAALIASGKAVCEKQAADKAAS